MQAQNRGMSRYICISEERRTRKSRWTRRDAWHKENRDEALRFLRGIANRIAEKNRHDRRFRLVVKRKAGWVEVLEITWGGDAGWIETGEFASPEC